MHLQYKEREAEQSLSQAALDALQSDRRPHDAVAEHGALRLAPLQVHVPHVLQRHLAVVPALRTHALEQQI